MITWLKLGETLTKHTRNICEDFFFDYLVKTRLKSHHLIQFKLRFSKFAFKKSWLENYLDKVWLKSLKNSIFCECVNVFFVSSESSSGDDKSGVYEYLFENHDIPFFY